MIRSRLSRQRLAALFFLGCVVFNYPVLSIFDRAGSVFGLPLLYAWLMGVWLLLIALLAWVNEFDSRGLTTASKAREESGSD